MRGATPPLPEYVCMAWCFVKHRDSFAFTLILCDVCESQSAQFCNAYFMHLTLKYFVFNVIRNKYGSFF